MASMYRFLLGQVRVPVQAFPHAHDGVHRRADLVAHVRQELLLDLFAVLGAFLGLAQFRCALRNGPLQIVSSAR